MERKRRVVITGMGMLTSIGSGKDQFAKALRAGRSGIGRVTRFNPEGFASQIAGEIKDYHPEQHFAPEQLEVLDLYAQYGIVAAREAWRDSGLSFDLVEPERIGVALGTAVGGIMSYEDGFAKLSTGAGEQNRALYRRYIPHSCASEIARDLGLEGRTLVVSTGCAAGTTAIGMAAHYIRSGTADAMIAGGAEAPLSPLCFNAFCVIHAMSTRNDDPQRASRPFDRNRDGFVVAEGAGIFVLEEYQRAVRRGAKIYAEILGYASTCNAYHMTAPLPDASMNALALEKCLAQAGVRKEEVDYINAHGSSTPLNDKTETFMYKRVFGDLARRIPISSTKSMVGHPLGAAGAIELAATVIGMQEGFFPPTANLEEPDSECDLDYVPNEARPGEIRVALSNSSGYSGINACILVGKPG